MGGEGWVAVVVGDGVGGVGWVGLEGGDGWWVQRPNVYMFHSSNGKTSIGGNREGNREEIGGNRGWFWGNRSCLPFVDHSFCSTGRAGIRGEVPLYKFKKGKMEVGCVGEGGEGGGKPRGKVGVRGGNFGNGAKWDARVDQWFVLFVCACIITPL